MFVLAHAAISFYEEKTPHTETQQKYIQLVTMVWLIIFVSRGGPNAFYR